MGRKFVYRLTVEKDKNGKGSCVQVYSSSEMLSATQPKWNLIYTKCFEQILNRQGIAASKGDVLFTGTKKNGSYVEAGELSSEGH